MIAWPCGGRCCRRRQQPGSTHPRAERALPRCRRAGVAVRAGGDRARLAAQLRALLRCVALLGLLVAAFGPAYSYTLLRLLYGAKWSDSGAPRVLACYCGYVLVLALNGAPGPGGAAAGGGRCCRPRAAAAAGPWGPGAGWLPGAGGRPCACGALGLLAGRRRRLVPPRTHLPGAGAGARPPARPPACPPARPPPRSAPQA